MAGLNFSTGHRVMSGKNWVMSDESCFTTDIVIRREVNFSFLSYRCLKTQKHLVSIDISCSGFCFYGQYNRQFFIFKTLICVWVNIFSYCLGQLPVSKHFICHFFFFLNLITLFYVDTVQ